MRKIFKKMTQNNKRNRDYVLCHPRNLTRENYLGSRNEFSDWIPDRVWNDKNSGFTILFAVIVSTLVLALGLGIVAITVKEVQLSGAGRDSQLAFYAADSGSECALYFDTTTDSFATSSDSLVDRIIICNGQNIVASTTPNPTSKAATSTFQMCMEYSSGNCVINKPCVDVTVMKWEHTIQSSGATTTKTSIDARGYNTCDENHPRRLERGYRLNY